MSSDVKPYQYLLFFLFFILGIFLEIAVPAIGLFFYRESSYYDTEIFGIEGDVFGALLFFLIFIIAPFYTVFMVAISTKLSGICPQQFPPVITSTEEKMDNDWLNPKDNGGSFFYVADDKQLVVRYRDRKKYIILFSILLIFTFISTIDNVVKSENPTTVFCLCLSFVFMLCLPYFIFRPAKYVVFDRMTGLVTIPGLFIFPPQKVPFEKVRQGNVFYLADKFMGLTNTFTWTAQSIPGRMNSDSWSFYVWYMDKNRPLPHGTLLDPYREQDFLRRQAEGFPPPKYESWPTVTISDDRYGYLYATDEFKKIQKSFRVPIAAAYRLIHKELRKINDTITEESIVLTGVWNSCYVFCLNVPLNPKLQLFTDVTIPDGSMLINGKKGRFYMDYKQLINNS